MDLAGFFITGFFSRPDISSTPNFLTYLGDILNFLYIEKWGWVDWGEREVLIAPYTLRNKVNMIKTLFLTFF